MNARILEALAVTAELCGHQISEAAARVMVEDLSRYPEDAVLKALTRCRHELTGRFSLPAIIQRIDDGRPGAEEAWALASCLNDEDRSFIVNDEIMEASGVCRELLEQDPVAARMAFKEAYARVVCARREAGEIPRWYPTLGYSPEGRADCLIDGAKRGQISASMAIERCPIQHRDRITKELGILEALPNPEAQASVMRAITR